MSGFADLAPRSHRREYDRVVPSRLPRSQSEQAALRAQQTRLKLSSDPSGSDDVRRAAGSLRRAIARARPPSVQLEVEGCAPLEVALSRILSSCLDQILASEAAAYDASDPEGVHEMRIGVRRLRTALSLFRPVLPRDQGEAFRSELRDLALMLGSVRDLDVLGETVLHPLRDRASRAGPLVLLCAEADRLREERQDALRAALDAERFAQLVLELAGWIAASGWRDQPLTPRSARLFQPLEQTAPQLLDKRCRKLGRGDVDRVLSSPERRHQLRVRIKQLRYSCEFFAAAFEDKASRRYTKRAVRAQEALGKLNDLLRTRELLAVVVHRVGDDERVALQSAADFVLGWAAHDADDLVDRAERAWKRLASCDPFWR